MKKHLLISFLLMIGVLSLIGIQSEDNHLTRSEGAKSDEELEAFCNAEHDLPQGIAVCILATRYGVDEGNIWVNETSIKLGTLTDTEVENYYPVGCISDVPSKALYIPFIEIGGNQISVDWEFIDNTDCYVLRGSAVFTSIMPVKVISIVPSSIT